MDWWGVIVGAVAGVLVDRLFGEVLERKGRRWLRRRRNSQTDREWANSDLNSATLQVVQTGWSGDGSFGPEAVTVLLGDDDFEAPSAIASLREVHRQEWVDAGHHDGVQVGIRSLQIQRISDEPADLRDGRSHVINIVAQRYRYFDFLATHVALLRGTTDEKKVLTPFLPHTPRPRPIDGFPNPLSVGLSLLCEDGDALVLTTRGTEVSAGGWWHGGATFNAVGEGCAPKDFRASSADGSLRCTPSDIARRGLYEELGLSDHDVNEGRLMIHTLAWAPDLLDLKFLGAFTTPIVFSELSHRYAGAPDRTEHEGLQRIDVSTGAACRALVARMREEPEAWSPEATTCTLRTLLVLGRIGPGALRGGNGRTVRAGTRPSRDAE